MKRKFLWGCLALALTGGFSGGALAQRIDLNNYTLNFSDAGSVQGDNTLSDLTNVDDWEFTAFSVIGFKDTDASNSITAGDLFDDYIIGQVKGFTDVLGNDITPGNYRDEFEMTAVIKAQGVQTTNNSYALSSMDQFEFIFDAGSSFTQASNSTDGSTASTYTDGLIVEQASLVTGGGVNSGPVLPDGETAIVGLLNDLLSAETCGAGNCDPLEKDFLNDLGTEAIVLKATDLLLGIVDSNNNAFYSSLTGGTPGLQAASYIGTVDGVFGSLSCGDPTTPDPTCAGSLGDYDFYFATKSEGSFNKAAVIPEPGVLTLLGLGLAGMGFVGRRSKKASATA